MRADLQHSATYSFCSQFRICFSLIYVPHNHMRPLAPPSSHSLEFHVKSRAKKRALHFRSFCLSKIDGRALMWVGSEGNRIDLKTKEPNHMLQTLTHTHTYAWKQKRQLFAYIETINLILIPVQWVLSILYRIILLLCSNVDSSEN